VKDFMAAYHADLPVETFTRPEGLTTVSLCIPSWLRATDSCPLKTPSDLLATRAVPSEGDNWWTRARIDTRTGKLASALTPEQYAEERNYLNIPSGISEFARDEALGWQYVLQGTGGTPPTEETEESDIPAVINDPTNGTQATGVLSVLGRASSAAFESYRLEFQGESGDWTLLMESTTPVEDGVLGVWDTTLLGSGLYTLRLTVVDSERGELGFSVQVVVLPPGEPPPPAVTTPAGPGGAGRPRR
jgi:hypothetical protein